jgi:hypothetical protein
MLPIKNFKFFFLRSAIAGFAVAGLFYFCTSGYAQRAGGERPSRFMNRIDAEEGAEKLAAFRNQRLAGDYFFEFQLEHKPRRARTVRFDGMMWGSWNAAGPVSRIMVYPNAESGDSETESADPVELIVQNGPAPEAWIRRSGKADFQPIRGEALFEPILPGLFYSPFDLQMPFVYWESFEYEGPKLAMGSRVAQQFLMLPPEQSPSAKRGISGVRIGLDDTYDALLTIEVIDAEEAVTSRFAVESVQKLQKQHIVKRITLTDYPSKDRTTFKVDSASVGLSLNRDLFRPHERLDAEAHVPDSLESL